MKQFVFVTLLVAAFPAISQVSVNDPWIRGTVSQQKATGAFMQLKAEQNSRLAAVATPIAGIVEIHEMAMEKDVMRMRALPKGLELPAGKTVELKPGGYHVMLMDLKQQVKEGETIPLTLTIVGADGKSAQIEVKAPVRPLGEARKMDGMHKH